MGAWLWVLLGAALVLLAGVASGIARLRRAGRSVARPIGVAVAIGLILAAGLTYVVPIWTLADPGALSAPIDYAIAFLLALVPAGMASALIFSLASRR
jgi:hypothetical protein